MTHPERSHEVLCVPLPLHISSPPDTLLNPSQPPVLPFRARQSLHRDSLHLPDCMCIAWDLLTRWSNLQHTAGCAANKKKITLIHLRNHKVMGLQVKTEDSEMSSRHRASPTRRHGQIIISARMNRTREACPILTWSQLERGTGSFSLYTSRTQGSGCEDLRVWGELGREGEEEPLPQTSESNGSCTRLAACHLMCLAA